MNHQKIKQEVSRLVDCLITDHERKVKLTIADTIRDLAEQGYITNKDANEYAGTQGIKLKI